MQKEEKVLQIKAKAYDRIKVGIENIADNSDPGTMMLIGMVKAFDCLVERETK